MQLFITHYMQEGNTITITEERVLHQLTKVLRAKKGDKITVQWLHNRVVCEIDLLEKRYISAVLVEKESRQLIDDQKYLAVALPNKFEKLELIVQKCTEIGVQHIIFFPAKHSLLKEISETKMERLEKISLEAVEQSRGRNKIEMTFLKNVFFMCEGKKVFVAHQHGKIMQNAEYRVKKGDDVIILVGPEGGRHADEEKMFDEMLAEKISLGESVLRTETASIIGGRVMKNFL